MWRGPGREYVRVPHQQFGVPSREYGRVVHPAFGVPGRAWVVEPVGANGPSPNAVESSRLREENERLQEESRLREENERLQEENRQLREIDRLRIDNERLTRELANMSSAPSKLRTCVAASRETLSSEEIEEAAATACPPPAPTLPQLGPAAASKDRSLDEYERSGGCVPLTDKVAEVQALSDAMSRYRFKHDRNKNQIAELERIIETVEHTHWGRHNLDRRLAELTTSAREAHTMFEQLQRAFMAKRFDVLAAFKPELHRSVMEYERRMASVGDGAAAALEEVERLCAALAAPHDPLHQTVPESASAHGPCSIECLFALLSRARQALPALEWIGERVRACGGEHVAHLKVGSLKGVPRCLQKVQEEYGGDYSRLVDLARISIIFDDLPALLRGLRWLLGEQHGDSCDGDGDGHAGGGHAGERRGHGNRPGGVEHTHGILPSFEARRAKDRISLAYDAELSGGYRDVIVVGELTWGTGPSGAPPHTLLVEVQLHLRTLFELKHEVHVLYKSLRGLGAADDEVVLHRGQLSEDALRRAANGIVRRLECDYTPLLSARAVADVLQGDCCSLLSLRIAGPRDEPGAKRDVPNDLAGWTIERLLIGDAPGARLQATRLQCLVLARRGLRGELPDCLSLLTCLKVLGLNGNQLSGTLPPSLCGCIRLEWVYLQSNDFSGPLPAAWAAWTKLKGLQLQWNRVSGPLPHELVTCWTGGIRHCAATHADADGHADAGPRASRQQKAPLAELHLAGNHGLVVTQEQRAALLEVLGADAPGTALTWPESTEDNGGSLKPSKSYKLARTEAV